MPLINPKSPSPAVLASLAARIQNPGYLLPARPRNTIVPIGEAKTIRVWNRRGSYWENLSVSSGKRIDQVLPVLTETYTAPMKPKPKKVLVETRTVPTGAVPNARDIDTVARPLEKRYNLTSAELAGNAVTEPGQAEVQEAMLQARTNEDRTQSRPAIVI